MRKSFKDSLKALEADFSSPIPCCWYWFFLRNHSCCHQFVNHIIKLLKRHFFASQVRVSALTRPRFSQKPDISRFHHRSSSIFSLQIKENIQHQVQSSVIKCKFCGDEFAGGASRIKGHLSGMGGKGIHACTRVPEEVQKAASSTFGGSNETPCSSVNPSSNMPNDSSRVKGVLEHADVLGHVQTAPFSTINNSNQSIIMGTVNPISLEVNCLGFNQSAMRDVNSSYAVVNCLNSNQSIMGNVDLGGPEENPHISNLNITRNINSSDLSREKSITGRKKDRFWQYVEPGLYGKVRCKFCRHGFVGGASRIKWHLSKTEKMGVEICCNVPENVQKAAKDTSNKRPKRNIISSHLEDNFIDSNSISDSYKGNVELYPMPTSTDFIGEEFRSFQHSFAASVFNSSMKIRRRTRPQFLKILCFPTHSNFKQEEDEADNGRVEDLSKVILVERYSDGTSKRYILDDNSQLLTLLVEEDRHLSKRFQDSHSLDKRISWLPDIVTDFILPAGFPGSVSDDYLNYMLLQFPTNVTAWICHAIVTSSLLKAVGIGSFSGTTAAASAAAIRWVSKDGIGAIGRLLVGGWFGNLFDDDPKQWRMYADFIGSAGSIFDLTTQLYPDYFLALASLGNLTKAVARGLKDPSFRVIQNHFAISGNLGEVAAKEEVWEVVAQLMGLYLGILILDTPGLVKSYPFLSFTWMGMRLLHLWLRYVSLSVLKFNTINIKRARILVKSHVLKSTVSGCVDCNKEENILAWHQFMKPQIIFGVPLEQMYGVGRSHFMVKTLLKLYAKEKYILTVNQELEDLRFLVSFKVGATSVSVLRSLWQTFWLCENWDSKANVCDQLANSLLELENRFEDFTHKLNDAGWDTQQLNLKVPKEISIDDIEPL
ncbi:hypothetical protein L6164_002274 [Bauhinia variegata]|uniref:Uncharacterized protein n=1 Tax=Bauhinia variegata TaxID=167791 RepID=A0ACB9Q363_BAUVA|nr:hypothetical protein L6164_002274 [Bauhinia variegata]